tara:strand:- start:21312 stop:22229 length:918 start_codon:yes stop_codon:yes gene_type:complete
MRIAFIGLGSIAQKHIAAIREIDDNAILFAVRHKENTPEVKGIENIPFNSLASQKLDAIILSNPSVYHQKSIIDLAPLGIPLMVEKPICISLDQWSALDQLAKKNPPPIYIACNLRFHPLIQFLQRYLQEQPEVIYEVTSYCGSYLPAWRPELNYTDSYSAKSSMGGGVQFDLIHELDYLTYLLGEPLEIEKQYRRISNLLIDSYDYAHYLATYQEFSASITLNYFRKDSKRTLEIVRENDTLLLNFIKGNIINLNTDKTLISIDKEGLYLSYLNQMKYFLHTIKTKNNLMNSLDESLRIIKTIL